jgi:ribonuclease R
MRSVARLTYERVQTAADGKPDDGTAPLMDRVIRPLYGAYRALREARAKRGTLDLDVPERRVMLDEKGRVVRIEQRRSLDSHKLIEEFMIAANVASAETLERRQRPCMYRIHPAPDAAKVEALREFLAPLDLGFAKGQVIRPKLFTQVLDRARNTPYAAVVNELVLRTQMQAAYSPNNVGHFGLALARYSHFTSPIRRYADLLVHRALVDALALGSDGLPPGAEDRFERIGEAISANERRAAAAERDAVDRYTAAYLSAQRGQTLPGRINGVTRFGLFVTLIESGGSGLVPISSLPNDFYDHDEPHHRLIGRRWAREYRLGEPVWAKIVEADPVTGGLVLHLVDTEEDEAELAEHAGRPASGKSHPRRRDLPENDDRRGNRPTGRGRTGRPGRKPIRKKRR